MCFAITEKPEYFDNDATSWTESRPIWGTCPVDVDNDGLGDAHTSSPFTEITIDPECDNFIWERMELLSSVQMLGMVM